MEEINTTNEISKLINQSVAIAEDIGYIRACDDILHTLGRLPAHDVASVVRSMRDARLVSSTHGMGN